MSKQIDNNNDIVKLNSFAILLYQIFKKYS